ncbi:MAG: hypothetical protein GYB65_00815 [Chloroflexi bacterium]|nr:hypothetical protein [Chloroflexota bacterium]
MRKSITLILLVLLVGPALWSAAHPAGAQGGGNSDVTHLVLGIEGNAQEAVFNRLEWDFDAFVPLTPGTSLRANDYMEMPSGTTVWILCADLEIQSQSSVGVPPCSEYPEQTAFSFPDDPTWQPGDEPDGGGTTDLSGAVNTINGLSVEDDVKAFALAALLRNNGQTADAIEQLTALPELGCQRPGAVRVPDEAEYPLVQSPTLYLRLGELYEISGDSETAKRYYGCARTLADGLNDPATTALAAAREANASEIGDAIPLYQIAINNYQAIGAVDYVEEMVSYCGRDCTTN